VRLEPFVLALLIPSLAPTARADDAPVVAAQPAPAPGATPPVAAGEHPNLGLSTQRKLAIAALSAGGAGFILGTIMGVATISTWTVAESECGNGCSATSNAQTEKAHATTEAAVSTASFIAGSVLLAGGIALWLTEPSKETTAPPQPSVGLAPGWGGLTILGRF
jgi:hypothetical protein